MTEIKSNVNFYSFAGSCEPEQVGPDYREYRAAWHKYPEKLILRDFPMHLDIEITSRCNLRCTFCDKLPVLQPGQLGYMDPKLFRAIIDEGARNRLWGVKLSYRGEPLLHKDVAAMVGYAKKKGVLDVYFNTNGMLLDERMCGELIDAGLDRLSVSVDGNDPALFEKERAGAKFEVILGNIEGLAELKKKRAVSHPQVRVQSVLFTGFDSGRYREFWAPRCDEVAAVDYKDGAKREQGIRCDWACPQLWQRMTIEWDGTVHPCNNDDSGLMPLSNVLERSVRECWHDARLRRIRCLHREGRSHEVTACDGCPWRTSQIRKLQGGVLET